MKAYGYARVSTAGQSYEAQVEMITDYCKLRGFDLLRVFADKRSGKNTDRVEFGEMMQALETNPFDVGVIVFTKLDRVGRSLRDLIGFVDWCNNHKIGVAAIGNNIDTTTKEGRLTFYIFGSIAEYERELIQERTEIGKQRYRDSGGIFGRKKKVIPMETARRLIAEGVPKAEVARRLKIDRATLYKRLKESNGGPP